ncbi:hypothetical protein VXE65_32625 [Mycolicibacterium conceptionense]|uniref:hypothetical protein n=1 Tax=Mycolicibacterium conceptionense TaxID=451644 RepID=UPI003204D31D
MYSLTIDDHGADTTTLHDTPAAARATLHSYLELADYNYRPAQLSSIHIAYELLANDGDDPAIVGVATIEPYTELDARRELNTIFATPVRRPALAC